MNLYRGAVSEADILVLATNSSNRPTKEVASADMKAAQHDPSTLQAHMMGTYFNLRVGIALIGAALPILLWLGGKIADHEPLRGSMSAYYYSGAMRDTFVGALVTIGAFLYLYKGFSTQENWALNAAGVLAVAVAMVPTSPGPNLHSPGETIHGIAAVLFFLCIAYVCVFRAPDTTSLIKDAARAAHLRLVYRILGIAMVVSPLTAVALSFGLNYGGWRETLIFFVEAAGVEVFAAYWFIKSLEIRATGAEELALEGKLKAASRAPEPGLRFPGHLVQVEP